VSFNLTLAVDFSGFRWYLPWFTNSSLEMMCRRTSGNSSLSIWRNMGNKWSIVLSAVSVLLRASRQARNYTYSCLPRIGARPEICVPSAARTCCEVSDTKSSILPMISLRSVFLSTKAQKPGIWPAIAVRTSASLSLRSFTKAGTRSLETTSSSTAFAICICGVSFGFVPLNSRFHTFSNLSAII